MSTRYYFDIREGDQLAVDEEGMIFAHLSAAHDEAARALAGLIRDAVKHAQGALTEMSIEVRDDAGPVMHVKFTSVILRRN